MFRDTETGLLEVDLARANDVREQSGLGGENLSIRRSNSKEDQGDNLLRLSSNIQIKKSKSADGLGSEEDVSKSDRKDKKAKSTTGLGSEDLSSSGGHISRGVSAFRRSSSTTSRHGSKRADDLPDLPVIIRELDKANTYENEVKEGKFDL